MPFGGAKLNKYEAARLVGLRAEQLERGEYPLVPIPPNMYDPKEVAKLELAAGKLTSPETTKTLAIKEIGVSRR